MNNSMDKSWTELWPTLLCKRSRDEYVAYVRALARLPREDEGEETIYDLRWRFLERTTASRRSDRQVLVSAVLVLTDLAIQGWSLRVTRRRVQVRPPEAL